MTPLKNKNTWLFFFFYFSFQFLDFLLNLLNIENCLYLLPRLSFSHSGALESSHVQRKLSLSELSLLTASPCLPAGKDPMTTLDSIISSTVNPHFPLSLQPAAAHIKLSKPGHFFPSYFRQISWLLSRKEHKSSPRKTRLLVTLRAANTKSHRG